MKTKFKSSYTFKDIKGIYSLNQLAYIIGISRQELIKLSTLSENYYSPFVHPQTNREIDNPREALKEIQKKINDRILKLYPLCNCTFGGVEGKNTRDNAACHINKQVVVRLDLSKYFHSIKSKWVYSCFRRQFKFSQQISKLLTKICTYKGYVPVGAPTSSMLVNLVLEPEWRKIDSFAKEHQQVLTTWLDDIVISGVRAETSIQFIKEKLNNRGIKLNWKKKRIQRANKQQVVTGTVVNKKLGIPKQKQIEYAKTIRRSIADPSLQTKADGQIAYARFINKLQGNQLAKYKHT